MSYVTSILIPVHNREEFLTDCLNSACTQTVRDFEIVVVDNASTDSTWSICREFAARDPRVRIFRNDTNVGPVRNWHRCFAEARGLYGKVLFSDDLIAPEFLERTLPHLENPEVAFVFTTVEIGGKMHYRWNHIGKVSSELFIRDALHARDLPVSPGAALFRLQDLRDNLVSIGEDGAGPDLLLYLLTAARYPAVVHVDEPLASFQWHPGSLSYRRSAELADFYTHARIWFAARTNRKSHLEDALSAAWLSHMKARRRWIRPSEIQRIFLGAALNSPLCEAPCFASALRYLYRRKLRSP